MKKRYAVCGVSNRAINMFIKPMVCKSLLMAICITMAQTDSSIRRRKMADIAALAM